MPSNGGMDLTTAVVRIEGNNANLTSTLQQSEQLTAASGKKIEALTYGQFKRIANAEKLSAKERWALFGKTNQVQMSALQNLEKGATRTTGGIGRLNNALFTMVRQFTGLPTAVTQTVDALGTFSLGVSTMTVAIGVVAGLGLAFQALTKDQREAKKATDDLVKSLSDDRLKAMLGPTGEAKIQQASAKAALDAAAQKRATALSEIAAIQGRSQLDEGDVASLVTLKAQLPGMTDEIIKAGAAFEQALANTDKAFNEENKARAEAALQRQKEAESYKRLQDRASDASDNLDDKLQNLTLSLPQVGKGVEDMMAKAFGWAAPGRFKPAGSASFVNPLNNRGLLNFGGVGLAAGSTGRSALAGPAPTTPGSIFNGASLGKEMSKFHAEVKDTTSSTQVLADGIVNMATVGANAIAGFVTGAKVSFHDFVQTALAELSRLIAKLLVVTALKALFTGGGAFAGTSIGKLIAGSLEQRASGGPVAAGVPYLVGERGPELFMPSSSGSIVPHGGGGGSGLAAALLDALGPMPAMMSPADYATNQWVRKAFHLLALNESQTG